MSVLVNKISPLSASQISQAQPSVPSSKSVIEIGNTLDKRVTAFVVGLKLLNDAATFAAKKGTKAVCAATTLSAAMRGLYEGNVLQAAVLGAAGLKETYDLLMKDGSLAEIQRLLKENQAGLEVTSEILNFNKVVLKQASDGVDSIGKNLTSVEKDLSKIEQLSDEGRQELREEKKAIIKNYKSANKEYALAQNNFKKSQHYAERANFYFNETIQGFNKIYKLAQTEGAQISDAIIIAEEMQKNCEKAQKKLQLCMEYQDFARAHSDKANEIYRDASTKYGRLMGKTEDLLVQINKINEKAQVKIKEAQQQKDELAEKVGRLQTNNSVLVQLNEKLLENNNRLIEEAANAEPYGLTSIIAGAIPGAILGNAFGVTGGIVGGYVGLEVVHNRHKLARKTADWLFGIKKETPVTFAKGDKVACKFDDHSSGYWGRYIGKKASQSVGTIALKFGENEFFEMRFNLNDKNIVSDADLKKLSDLLTEKARTGLSHEKCMEFLSALEELRIDPKSSIDSKPKPVISKDNSFFYMLKNKLSTGRN